MSLYLENATELVEQIKTGRITSEELVGDCLARIEASDGVVGAWAHLDGELALAQARELDDLRRRGRALGPLHGVPVGIKDIFDTADLPTEYGSPIHAGRQPAADATAVAKLREAGAVIMGKTVTAELAFMTPGKTTNPHNPAHTPGGSSSGSAAAVAAGQVPLALGSQTGGSIIRPASFCGVFGAKPSRGSISRHGVLRTSQTLDQLGGFGRSLADVALLCDAVSGYDAADPASHTRPKPKLAAGCREEVPALPNLVWLELPFTDRLAGDAREGLDELLEALDGRVETMALPEALGRSIEQHRLIHHYELRRNLAQEYEDNREGLSEGLREVLDAAGAIGAEQYAAALAAIGEAGDFFDELFNDFDAIVTPAATGEASLGLAGTGDPVFCKIWTFCGLPCLTLPLLSGSQGLPIGVQLVGGMEDDARLCRTAQWLLRHLESL
jgi:Asp-tRNA(Asn)/Glu-tRNA(Gln) amidotransferase A subunit family amidase